MCADAHLATNPHSQLIAELRQSYARLAHNQHRRGYSVVILKRHANELYQLSDVELAGFWRDVADTAAALQRVFGAVKINYAVLGNLCPHVHCHLVPLYAADAPPPVLDWADGEVFLSDDEGADLIASLRHALRQRDNPASQPTAP
jgi:diadenosine tetraphosphate (Ap4A) HIT family hydrolase